LVQNGFSSPAAILEEKAAGSMAARAGAAARVAAYRQKPLGPDPGAFVAALRPRSVLEFGIPAAATAAVLPESPA